MLTDIHLNSSIPDFAAAKQYIDALDLTYIVNRMSAKPKITGWTKQEATLCSKMYKNYLLLIKKYPDKIIPPSKQIDEFWHEHILHTKQYHKDCLQIFGHYLHHEPGDGKTETYQSFMKVFDEVTQELYFLEYGEYL